jgi:DNA invertase Pin-like site-specific DNA recombinase
MQDILPPYKAKKLLLSCSFGHAALPPRIPKHGQRDALQEAGCEKYFSDSMTGSKFERKGLEQLLAFMRSGDTVIVWKLDRLGRSLKDLIETLNHLNNREVNFVSLTENIDTTTPGGKLIFHLMGALAEFERDLIRERTNAGLAAARARGRIGGRPRKLSTNGKVALALRLVEDSKHSIDDICSTLGISRSTLYRYVREAKKASRPSDPPA